MSLAVLTVVNNCMRVRHKNIKKLCHLNPIFGECSEALFRVQTPDPPPPPLPHLYHLTQFTDFVGQASKRSTAQNELYECNWIALRTHSNRASQRYFLCVIFSEWPTSPKLLGIDQRKNVSPRPDGTLVFNHLMEAVDWRTSPPPPLFFKVREKFIPAFNPDSSLYFLN